MEQDLKKMNKADLVKYVGEIKADLYTNQIMRRTLKENNSSLQKELKGQREHIRAMEKTINDAGQAVSTAFTVLGGREDHPERRDSDALLKAPESKEIKFLRHLLTILRVEIYHSGRGGFGEVANQIWLRQ